MQIGLVADEICDSGFEDGIADLLLFPPFGQSELGDLQRRSSRPRSFTISRKEREPWLKKRVGFYPGIFP